MSINPVQTALRSRQHEAFARDREYKRNDTLSLLASMTC
jgi:hypothetical protein